VCLLSRFTRSGVSLSLFLLAYKAHHMTSTLGTHVSCAIRTHTNNKQRVR
jgi:hypothetical protein